MAFCLSLQTESYKLKKINAEGAERIDKRLFSNGRLRCDTSM
jgi:hypothetical protein